MSTLLAGTNPKFDSKLTTLDALRRLPEPPPLGRRHHPVPHVVLVDVLHREVERRGYTTTRTQLALGANGAALFGMLDLVPTPTGVWVPAQDRILSLGFRNATDQRLAIYGVAGTHVLVCDNLALSGDTFAFKRKNTTGLDLADVIATGFDRFLQHARVLECQIERLAGTGLSDARAKQVIFDVFHAHIVPIRLFDDVSRLYLQPRPDQLDCQPRTAWGLHNAFTRAMRDLTPLRQFGATQALGRAFGLVAREAHGFDVTAATSASPASSGSPPRGCRSRRRRRHTARDPSPCRVGITRTVGVSLIAPEIGTRGRCDHGHGAGPPDSLAASWCDRRCHARPRVAPADNAHSKESGRPGRRFPLRTQASFDVLALARQRPALHGLCQHRRASLNGAWHASAKGSGLRWPPTR